MAKGTRPLGCLELQEHQFPKGQQKKTLKTGCVIVASPFLMQQQEHIA